MVRRASAGVITFIVSHPDPAIRRGYWSIIRANIFMLSWTIIIFAKSNGDQESQPLYVNSFIASESALGDLPGTPIQPGASGAGRCWRIFFPATLEFGLCPVGLLVPRLA